MNRTRQAIPRDPLDSQCLAAFEHHFVGVNKMVPASTVKQRLARDPRYPFHIPRTDNGNYLWIQHFHAALNKTGRAGFVMANSAADARASEQDIREKIIRAGKVLFIDARHIFCQFAPLSGD